MSDIYEADVKQKYGGKKEARYFIVLLILFVQYLGIFLQCVIFISQLFVQILSVCFPGMQQSLA